MSKIFCGTTQISAESVKKPSKISSEIRLFKIKLSSYYHLVPNLMLYSTEAEIQRGEKYHFNKDSNQFLISRGFIKIYTCALH
jgi:hypothetical protein